MKGHNRTVRGTKKGVMGTGGPKRGKRAISKSQGIAMKPRGKGSMRQSHVQKMESKDYSV